MAAANEGVEDEVTTEHLISELGDINKARTDAYSRAAFALAGVTTWIKRVAVIVVIIGLLNVLTVMGVGTYLHFDRKHASTSNRKFQIGLVVGLQKEEKLVAADTKNIVVGAIFCLQPPPATVEDFVKCIDGYVAKQDDRQAKPPSVTAFPKRPTGDTTVVTTAPVGAVNERPVPAPTPSKPVPVQPVPAPMPLRPTPNTPVQIISPAPLPNPGPVMVPNPNGLLAPVIHILCSAKLVIKC